MQSTVKSISWFNLNSAVWRPNLYVCFGLDGGFLEHVRVFLLADVHLRFYHLHLPAGRTRTWTRHALQSSTLNVGQCCPLVAFSCICSVSKKEPSLYWILNVTDLLSELRTAAVDEWSLRHDATRVSGTQTYGINGTRKPNMLHPDASVENEPRLASLSRVGSPCCSSVMRCSGGKISTASLFVM